MITTRAVTAALTAVLALGLLAGCESGKPDVTACKAAMKARFMAAVETGATTEGQPQECRGVDDQTLVRLAAEIAEEVA